MPENEDDLLADFLTALAEVKTAMAEFSRLFFLRAECRAKEQEHMAECPDWSAALHVNICTYTKQDGALTFLLFYAAQDVEKRYARAAMLERKLLCR